MNLGKRSRGAVALAAVVVAAASGCSTKAPESSGGGGGGGEAVDVQTDIGIEGETIRLGVLGALRWAPLLVIVVVVWLVVVRKTETNPSD